MVEASSTATEAQAVIEFPNIVGLMSELNRDNPFGHFLHTWESAIYSILVIGLLGMVFYFAMRSPKLVPGRLQSFAEFLVVFVDDFVCSILGPKGRKYTPFIGTLFIYILTMNYIGLVPFFKSPNADWSTTMAMSLIVFFYVQYTAFKELGFVGYFDHLMGQPRGAMAFTLIMPLFMFSVHVVSELIRPLSLSLRLRSNIYGDDMILALFASWGLKDGFIWLFPNFFLVLLTSTIQAAVFSILSLVYFSLIMKHEEEH
jgi:F-type H+-transporting ATPase subunit a